MRLVKNGLKSRGLAVLSSKKHPEGPSSLPAPPVAGEADDSGTMSRSISRVLSWTTIHLRQASPPACSDLPESAAGNSTRIPIWSCSGWGLPSPRLLPAARCALTAPFHPYPASRAVYFLLHFP